MTQQNTAIMSSSIDLEVDSHPPSHLHDTVSKPPRTSFLTSKLKDTETLKKFQDKIEELSDTAHSKMEAEHLKFQQKKISQQTYINHLSSLFTQILQTAGAEILKSPSKKIPDPDRPPDKTQKHYSTTPDTPEASDLKKLISTARSQLKQALKNNAPLAQLDTLYKNNSQAIHNLKKILTVGSHNNKTFYISMQAQDY